MTQARHAADQVEAVVIPLVNPLAPGQQGRTLHQRLIDADQALLDAQAARDAIAAEYFETYGKGSEKQGKDGPTIIASVGSTLDKKKAEALYGDNPAIWGRTIVADKLKAALTGTQYAELLKPNGKPTVTIKY